MRITPKRHRVIRAGRWIPLAAAAMAIAGSAVALGAVQRRATTTVPPQALGSVTAKCKHGQVALAAGFDAPGFNPNTTNGPVARLDSMPAGKRGIKTAGFNFNQTDPGELGSLAYCGKRAHPPLIRSKRVQVAPNSFGTVVAKCPPGSVAIAGGFGTNQTIVTLISKRTGNRRWKVGGFSIGGSGNPAGPGRLTAYAFCKKPGPNIVTRSKSATVSSGLRTLNVKCPNHGKALSGGFDGHVGRTGSQITGTGALISKRTSHGRGWSTSALSVSSPNQATMTTYAYCHR